MIMKREGNMQKNKHHFFCCLLTGLLVCLVPLHVFCWGFFGHKQINYHAVFLLPPQLYAFYKTHIRYVQEHAADADMRRYAVAAEAPRHYIDMDHYGASAAQVLPQDWQEAVLKFSEDTLHAHGIAPWWIITMHGRLQQAFASRNVEAILKVSADIGHYIADVHVPLHASSNHNGQKTDQHGIHGFWESRLPELFAVRQYDFLIGRAGYLERPKNFIWERIHESARAADTVLALEKKLSQSTPSHARFAYEQRNGMVVRQYAEKYAAAYHRNLNGMVERRMRDAIYAVASFWYTAWIDAGQPDLSGLHRTPGNNSTTLDLDTLQAAWINSKILGRSCTN